MEQGKYIVSFEGTKFEITSKIPLEIGRGFKATAQIQNNTIKLIPETERAELALSLQKFSDKDIESTVNVPGVEIPTPSNGTNTFWLKIGGIKYIWKEV